MTLIILIVSYLAIAEAAICNKKNRTAAFAGYSLAAVALFSAGIWFGTEVWWNAWAAPFFKQLHWL